MPSHSASDPSYALAPGTFYMFLDHIHDSGKSASDVTQSRSINFVFNWFTRIERTISAHLHRTYIELTVSVTSAYTRSVAGGIDGTTFVFTRACDTACVASCRRRHRRWDLLRFRDRLQEFLE
jgi:hypothetical protein